MESISDFIALVSVQLVVFFVFYLRTRTNTSLLSLLTKSCLIGIPFGVGFDLAIGHVAGVFTYILGFDLVFLAVNGLLSYGFMIATVWCWKEVSFFRFHLYSIMLGAVYEITNYFFPVWEWTFSSTPWQEYVIVVGAAYTGLSLLMALCLRLCVKLDFTFLPKKT